MPKAAVRYLIYPVVMTSAVAAGWLLYARGVPANALAIAGIGLFLDVGSVWDAETERHVRVSSGVGFYAGPAFFVVGFPVNTDDLRAIFTMGLRIPGVRIQW